MEKRKVEGIVDDAKGRAKRAVGELTGNDRLRGEGLLDSAKGKAKKAVADISEGVKKAIGKMDHRRGK